MEGEGEGEDEGGDRPTFPDDPSVQHSHLARLLVRLKAVSVANDPGEVCRMLDLLASDVRQHFASEEYMMERMDYSLIDEHRERHAKFIHHLERLQAECGDVGGSLAPAVAEQLENWFHDHEHTADADLLSFLTTPR